MVTWLSSVCVYVCAGLQWHSHADRYDCLGFLVIFRAFSCWKFLFRNTLLIFCLNFDIKTCSMKRPSDQFSFIIRLNETVSVVNKTAMVISIMRHWNEHPSTIGQHYYPSVYAPVQMCWLTHWWGSVLICFVWSVLYNCLPFARCTSRRNVNVYEFCCHVLLRMLLIFAVFAAVPC